MSDNMSQLKTRMEIGFQTSGISFWRHGEMVAERCMDLMQPERKMEWMLPEWFTDNEEWIKRAISKRMTVILEYQLWHDCGKPFCREEDLEGKVHYSRHAQVSERAYRKAGGSVEIAALIGKDMLCHTSRTSDAEALAKDPDIVPLLVTALCETHANAGMFGGLDSDSFKIKWKRLNSLGKAIMRELKPE